jgi:uncharacterized phage protein (TIGR02220 family)
MEPGLNSRRIKTQKIIDLILGEAPMAEKTAPWFSPPGEGPADQPPLPPLCPNRPEDTLPKAPEISRPSPSPLFPKRGTTEQGWVKLYRKLLDHPIFKSKDDKLFKTFIYCLLRAGYKETEIFFNHQSVKLKPGEFITGREQAARDLGFSPKTFDRKVSDLQIMQIMTRTMTHRFSIISITNWDTYQGKTEEIEEDDPPNGTNLHGRCTRDGHKQERKKENTTYSQNSLEVLSYLNDKTGRHYRDASHIEARLRDGGAVEECKAIIDKKLKDKHFIENPKYLNPVTLFRKSHWDKYLNEPSEVKPTW